MNKYIGKICPYCKTKFEEGDSIIVCSSCDMPHHKECWVENQGCTTFGCMGTIKAVDSDATTTVTTNEISYEEPSSESSVFCTRCGTQSPSSASFCRRCGNPLRTSSAVPVYTQANTVNTNLYAYTPQNYNPHPTYTQQPQQNAYGNNNTYIQQNYYPQRNAAIAADVAALIGKNREYYIPKFQKMKSQQKKTSWNWPAFFFSPYWFIYRKMYGCGIVAFIFALLATALADIVLIPVLSLGVYISIGIFANYIYMQRLEKKANQAKSINEPYKTQFIQSNGGVSGVALAIAIIGWTLLYTILFRY